jgi:uncharacterized secreted protein with C-terminal beta-propeller domain
MILAEVPLLSDTTDQIVGVVLSNNTYTLRVLWNERGGYFSLSVYEREGAVIVENVKMVKNYPLLGRFKDTRLPVGDLYFIDNKNKNDRPLYTSNGTGDYSLVYYEPDEVITVETVVQASTSVSGSIWDSGLSVWDSGGSVWD